MDTQPSPNPETRKIMMRHHLERSGCEFFDPTPQLTLEMFNLKQIPGVPEEDLQVLLPKIISYLNKPLIVDPFDDNNRAREDWREQKRKEWGKLFYDVYGASKMSRAHMGQILAAVGALYDTDMEHGGKLKDELVEVNKDELPTLLEKLHSTAATAEVVARLKHLPTDKANRALDRYAYLPFSKKRAIVARVCRLGAQVLYNFLPDGELAHRALQNPYLKGISQERVNVEQIRTLVHEWKRPLSVVRGYISPVFIGLHNMPYLEKVNRSTSILTDLLSAMERRGSGIDCLLDTFLYSDDENAGKVVSYLTELRIRHVYEGINDLRSSTVSQSRHQFRRQLVRQLAHHEGDYSKLVTGEIRRYAGELKKLVNNEYPTDVQFDAKEPVTRRVSEFLEAFPSGVQQLHELSTRRTDEVVES